MTAANPPGPMELAALLTSKVCHDLVNPVGAINNGLEVLGDKSNADMHDFAMDLVIKSVAQASAKLKFCRMAYGAGASAGSEIDLGEAGEVAREFVTSERTSLTWNSPPGGLAKDRVKLVLNLLVIANTIIPRGGEITVDIDPSAESFSLTAAGTNAKVPAGVAEIVGGQLPESAIDSQTIQPYYTYLVAQDAGLTVSFAPGEETVRITAARA